VAGRRVGVGATGRRVGVGGTGVNVGVSVTAGVGVSVGVSVGVGVGLCTGVGVYVTVGVNVGLGVLVAVGVAVSGPSPTMGAREEANMRGPTTQPTKLAMSRTTMTIAVTALTIFCFVIVELTVLLS